MTAVPLSAEEQARYDRIEAAPHAEESAVERVARAIHDADPRSFRPVDWSVASRLAQADYRTIAVAAIDAMKGSHPAEEAVRRVEALCAEADRLACQAAEAHGVKPFDGAPLTWQVRAAITGSQP